MPQKQPHSCGESMSDYTCYLLTTGNYFFLQETYFVTINFSAIQACKARNNPLLRQKRVVNLAV